MTQKSYHENEKMICLELGIGLGDGLYVSNIISYRIIIKF